MAKTPTKSPKNSPAPAQAAEQPILAWDAKEFTEYERNKRWYVLVAVAGALLTAGALYFQQWLVGAVFALATFVVIKHADDKPRTISYSISKLGIHVGDKFYPYNELKVYWLVYNPPVKTLTLQGISRFKPLIKIHLDNLDPLAVQGALKDYLAEQPKQSEDLIDRFSRMIRL